MPDLEQEQPKPEAPKAEQKEEKGLIHKGAEKAGEAAVNKVGGKIEEKAFEKVATSVAGDAAPGLGEVKLATGTLKEGTDAVEKGAKMMDSNASKEEREEAKAEFSKDAVKLGAKGTGAAIGGVLGSVEPGGGTAAGAVVGAQIGDVAGTVLTAVGADKLVEPVVGVAADVGMQANDQIKSSTGVNLAGETSKVAGTAASVAEGADNLTNPMAMVKTGTSGDLSQMTGKHDGMIQVGKPEADGPKAEGKGPEAPKADDMMSKLSGMMGQKGAEVDPAALTQKQGAEPVTPGAHKAAEATPSMKEQASGPKMETEKAVKPEEPKAKSPKAGH